MKVLAITYCFVPLRFPATYRLLKWFKYLDEVGHQVTVLSVDPASFAGPKDPGLDRLVPRNVENIRAWSLENTILYRVLGKRESWLYPLFQPFKKPWYGPAKKALRSLPLEEYDLVFSCSQPPICHLLGHEVKKKAGLPWVAYFSDPWVDSPYRSNVPNKIREYNLALERDVISSADKVIFSTNETTQMVLRKYSPDTFSKAHTLDHCFVPEWFDLVDLEEPKEDGVVKILLTGNFYGPRTPIPFLQMLDEVNTEHNLVGKIMFEFYGGMSDPDLRDPIWSSVKGFAKFGGAVDYLTSLAMMKNADCLLLVDAPLGSAVESVFFPLKLAEYMGSGRPIIGLTPERGATTRILRELGSYVFDLKDKAGISDLLGKVATKQIPMEPDLRGRAKYGYRCVGQQLVKILEMAAAGR